MLMVPLTHIRKNRRCRVRGSRGRQRRRNEALGFVPGEELTVIQSNQGNLIVCLRGCRYALDRDQANSIFVEDCNEES